jgi:hypothetical protein
VQNKNRMGSWKGGLGPTGLVHFSDGSPSIAVLVTSYGFEESWDIQDWHGLGGYESNRSLLLALNANN